MIAVAGIAALLVGLYLIAPHEPVWTRADEAMQFNLGVGAIILGAAVFATQATVWVLP